MNLFPGSPLAALFLCQPALSFYVYVEREKFALKRVPLIPHIGHQAVLAAAVGITDMPRSSDRARE